MARRGTQRGVGNTALGAAVCRLIEQYQPGETRLFDDPLVQFLVGGPLRVMVRFGGMRNLAMCQMDAITTGIYGAQVCRTRCIDDAVGAALSHGIDQLAILGAGLDTRPYRLPGMERVRVFEVDLPRVQADKKNKIQQYFGLLPRYVTFVPIDFAAQSLDTALVGAGFDPARPAVFIWEGVTQYLPEEAVGRTLAFVGRCAPGSVILFTYVLKSVIEGRSGIPGADRMMASVAENNAPWLFGLDPPAVPAFLESFHLSRVADVGNADYQERYLKPSGRRLAVSEIERVVQASR